MTSDNKDQKFVGNINKIKQCSSWSWTLLIAFITSLIIYYLYLYQTSNKESFIISFLVIFSLLSSIIIFIKIFTDIIPSGKEQGEQAQDLMRYWMIYAYLFMIFSLSICILPFYYRHRHKH